MRQKGQSLGRGGCEGWVGEDLLRMTRPRAKQYIIECKVLHLAVLLAQFASLC